MLSFVKHIFCIYWDEHIIFIFYSINVVHCINWFAFIEPSLNPKNKLTWSWYMFLLVCYYVQFASILMHFLYLYSLGILFCCALFVSIFIKNTGLFFSFLDMYLPYFGIRVVLASSNEFGGTPSYLIFLEESEKEWH
jgi:hypothetical protein